MIKIYFIDIFCKQLIVKGLTVNKKLGAIIDKGVIAPNNPIIRQRVILRKYFQP